jgi:hypothetical protein
MRFWFLADVKNGNNTGMGEAPSRFGLAQEPLAKLALCFTRLMGKRNAFDCDHAVNLWIPSSVHDAHRPSPDFVEDLVPPEASITKGLHPTVFALGIAQMQTLDCSLHFLSGYVGNCAGRTASF